MIIWKSWFLKEKNASIAKYEKIEYNTCMSIINTFWNLRQEWRINDTEYRSIRADYTSKRAEIATDDFRVQYDRMVLILAALWELIIEKWLITDGELGGKIIEIDTRDGVKDGRKVGKPLLCNQCGSGIVKQFKKCLVCGKEYPNISEIDSL